METFKVFGKLKRKELSFGFSDVRGVNKREERLLRSALGSLEKQRKRSLLNIQNEVADLHISLKETNNIWSQGDGHPAQEQLHIQAPKYQTPKTSKKNTKKVSKKQNSIKENFQGISNPKGKVQKQTNYSCTHHQPVGLVGWAPDYCAGDRGWIPTLAGS